MVDSLLAPLAAEVYQHQLARGLTSAQIAAALGELAHSVLSESRR